MTQNSQQLVFKGGREELENSVFTNNEHTFSGILFRYYITPNGSTIFLLNDTTVETYQLSIPWDPASVGAIGNTFSVSSEDTAPLGIYFRDNGTRMYILGQFTSTLYQYEVPTPFDISSIVAAPASLDLFAVEFSVANMVFSRDGDFLFVSGTFPQLDRYPLPTAWDITSASTTPDQFLTALGIRIDSIVFKPDGTKMYLGNSITDLITEFDLDSPYSLSPDPTVVNTKDMGISHLEDMYFRPNGEQILILNLSTKNITRFHLDTSWDITSSSHFTNSITTPTTTIFGINWKPDGTKFFILDADNVQEFTPITPWNITDAVAGATFNINSLDSNMEGMWWRPDGTRCYVMGTNSDTIFQLNVSTPWDVSTMTDSGISEFLPLLTTPSGITFRSDGRDLWVCDQSTNVIQQYNLLTAWDITSASIGSSQVISVGNLSHGIFKPDGKILYVADRGANDEVQSIKLSTPFDVQTIGETSSLFIGDKETVIRTISIGDNNGIKLYIGGDTTDIFSYDMSPEFNNTIITSLGEEIIDDLGDQLVHTS